MPNLVFSEKKLFLNYETNLCYLAVHAVQHNIGGSSTNKGGFLIEKEIEFQLNLIIRLELV